MLFEFALKIKKMFPSESGPQVSEVLSIMSDTADTGGSITSSELAMDDAPSQTAVPTLNLKATVANHEGCNGADKAISQSCKKMLYFTLSTHCNRLLMTVYCKLKCNCLRRWRKL